MNDKKDKRTRKTSGNWRGNMKADGIVKNKRNVIKSKEDRYVEKHHQGSTPITKKEFMTILKKAATPISEWQHDSKQTGTSESHLSDDYTDKCTNQDKTGDIKD